MKEYTWQHIEFEDGGNPYICMTETEFKRIQQKYDLVQSRNKGFWLAKQRNKT